MAKSRHSDGYDGTSEVGIGDTGLAAALKAMARVSGLKYGSLSCICCICRLQPLDSFLSFAIDDIFLIRPRSTPASLTLSLSLSHSLTLTLSPSLFNASPSVTARHSFISIPLGSCTLLSRHSIAPPSCNALSFVSTYS